MDLYIKLSDVKEIIRKLSSEPCYQHTGEDFYSGIGAVESELSMLPAVEAEPTRYGTWIHSINQIDETHSYHRWTCSLCGRTVARPNETLIDTLPYCYCGAKMSVEGK